MNLFYYSLIWTSFVNLFIFLLLIFSFSKLSASKLKSIFIALLLHALLWINVSLLVRFPGIDNDLRLIVARFNIAISVLLINLFAYFLFSFSNSQNPKKKNKFLIFFQVTSLIFIALSFTDYMLSSIYLNNFTVVGNTGIGFKLWVSFAIFYSVYIFWYAFHSYMKSLDPFFKIQMRYISFGSLLSFSIVFVDTGILPAFTEYESFSVGFMVGSLIFCTSVFYILLKEKKILISNEINEFLKAFSKTADVNINSFVTLLKSIQSKIQNTMPMPQAVSSSGTIGFIDEDENTFSVTISEKIKKLQLPIKLDKSQMIPSRFFTEKSVGFFKSKVLIPDKEKYTISDFSEIIEKNLEYNRNIFGFDLLCFSDQLFEVLEKIQKYSRASQPIVFAGETGSGKTTLAQALHNYRGGGDLTILSCMSETIESLRTKIETFINNENTQRPGILLQNLDELSFKDIGIIKPLLKDFEEKKYIYMTSNINLFSEHSELPVSIYYSIKSLNVYTIPLRERKADIFYQLIWLCQKYSQKTNNQIATISSQFMQQVMNYNWPGNYLELERVILQELFECKGDCLNSSNAFNAIKQTQPTKLSPLDEGERIIIIDTLRKHNNNKNRTRKELGITINTLNSRMIKHGIKLQNI